MNRDNEYLVGNQHAAGSGPNRTSFKKGLVPWNKDLKGIHLSPATEFKKGQKSLRRMPEGTITQRKHKGDGFRNWIKIGDHCWVEFAKSIWQLQHGAIIPGDVIHHMDGDSLNDHLDNLIAMPRADHPTFHSRWGLTQLSDRMLAHYRGRYEGRQL